MPKVDPVTTHPDPPEGPPTQDAPKSYAGVRGGGHHCQGGQGEQNHSARIEKGPVLIGGKHQNQDDEQTTNARSGEQPPVPPGKGGCQMSARPNQCQGRAEQQGEGPGVCPVINPAGIDSRLIHPRHRPGRQHRPCGDPDQQPASGQVAESRGQQQGPQEVELFLYGQGPQVSKGRGRPKLLKVRDVMKNVPPVAHIQEGCDQVSPEAPQSSGIGEKQNENHGDQQEPQCRDEAATAAHPEIPKIDPPCFTPFFR